MLIELCQQVVNKKEEIENSFLENHPKNYKDLFCRILNILNTKIIQIHSIEDVKLGSYDGSLIIIMKTVDHYIFATHVEYGSCSHCDTFIRIQEIKNKKEQAHQYYILGLHMFQKLKNIFYAYEDEI